MTFFFAVWKQDAMLPDLSSIRRGSEEEGEEEKNGHEGDELGERPQNTCHDDDFIVIQC